MKFAARPLVAIFILTAILLPFQNCSDGFKVFSFKPTVQQSGNGDGYTGKAYVQLGTCNGVSGVVSKIQNPAGFYVSLIRDNVAVPANFETSAKSEERSRRAEEHSAARQERARLENEFRTYQEQEVEGHLSALPAEELERLVTAAKAELIEEHKNLRGMISEEQLQRLARAGLATKLTKQLPRMTFSTFRKSRKVPSRIGQ